MKKYLCWDCAKISVKNSRVHAQKILHVLHIVGKTEQELRLFSPRGMNGIVYNSSNGGEKYPGVPVRSFCNGKLKQMNIAFVLRGRRDGAQGADFFSSSGGLKTRWEGREWGLVLVGLKNLGGDGMNKLDSRSYLYMVSHSNQHGPYISETSNISLYPKVNEATG